MEERRAEWREQRVRRGWGDPRGREYLCLIVAQGACWERSRRDWTTGSASQHFNAPVTGLKLALRASAPPGGGLLGKADLFHERESHRSCLAACS